MKASTLEIVHYPHPTLRHRSKPLVRVDAELRAMVARMFELMYAHKGVGLAANQVDLPYRFFVMNPAGDPEKSEFERVCINPVLSRAKGADEAEEGCLSLPGVHADVRRASAITVQCYTVTGEERTDRLEGFAARVAQHETDHLDGRLFIDRLSPTTQMALRETLDEFKLEFQSRRTTGQIARNADIASRLAGLEEMRT